MQIHPQGQSEVIANHVVNVGIVSLVAALATLIRREIRNDAIETSLAIGNVNVTNGNEVSESHTAIVIVIARRTDIAKTDIVERIGNARKKERGSERLLGRQRKQMGRSLRLSMYDQMSCEVVLLQETCTSRIV